MNSIYFLAAIVLSIGLLILFKINPLHFIRDIYLAYENRPKTVKQECRRLSGKKRTNFFVKSVRQTNRILESTGQADKKDFFEAFSILLAVFGFWIGIKSGNIFLSVVFTVAGFMLPQLYVSLMSNTYFHNLDKNLFAGLSLINSSYKRNPVFVSAVAENVDYLPYPLKKAFEQFLFDINHVSPNREQAVRKLKLRINHPIFRQWCDAVLMCLNDHTQSGMLDCINDLSDITKSQNTVKNIILNPVFMTLILSALAIFIGPFLAYSFPGIGYVMAKTLYGQLSVAALAAIVLFAIIRVVRVARPVKLKEGD